MHSSCFSKLLHSHLFAFLHHRHSSFLSQEFPNSRITLLLPILYGKCPDAPKLYFKNHKNTCVRRAFFPKCPYIRANPYSYGRLVSTDYLFAADTGGRRPLARGRFTNAPHHCTGSKVTPGSRRAEASVALDIKGLSDLTLPHVSGEIQNSEAFNVM